MSASIWLLLCRQGLDLGDKVTETVIQIDAELGKGVCMFGEQVFEENTHRMAEKDGVRDLHHGGFQMQGKQHAF